MRVLARYVARVRRIDVYVLAITILAVGVGAFELLRETNVAWDRVALLALLCGGTQLLRVGIESGSVSASVAVTFAAAISFGPTGGIAAALVGALVHACVPLRPLRPPQKSAFNAAVWVLSAATAAWSYQLLGGQTPPGRLGDDLLAAVPAAVAYFLINTGLVTAAISLSTRAPLRSTWTTNYGWLSVNYGLLALIGYIMAIAATRGPMGLLLIAALLILPWFSTRLYVAKARQAENEMTARLEDARRLNQALEHQALHDQLTELPNRMLLRRHLQETILGAGPDSHPACLLLLDLDRFSEINDTFGHAAGDRLLCELAGRLTAEFGDGGCVARLGGDQFAVWLPSLQGEPADPAAAARRVLTALDASFVLDGYSLDVGANVGVVLSPEHGTDPDMLLQRADVALNLAKGSSSRHVLYAPEQDPHSPERLALVADLRRAISQSAEGGELELHYQPKVELATGRLVGAEALLRWRHPQRGLVPPDQVIPMAERTGLIDPLTRCVLNTALRQVRDWQALGLHVPVAVNFSARNLQDADLPQLVAKLLMEHGVPGSQLLAEVTESQLMLDPELALRVLERLRALGVHVSIDDYGTGHSSLTYLNRLPADELKLDRSFIHGVSTNRGTASIVRSTTKLAHDLGLRVVAEGVEDRRSWDLMIQFGCDIVQGYFVSRPLPGPQFAAWAAEWLTRAAVRAA